MHCQLVCRGNRNGKQHTVASYIRSLKNTSFLTSTKGLKRAAGVGMDMGVDGKEDHKAETL